AERLEPALPGAWGRLLPASQNPGGAALEDREVELLLRREEAEDVRLRDARPLCHVGGRRARVAVRGDLLDGCVEDRLSSLCSLQPLGHAWSLPEISNYSITNFKSRALLPP